MTRLALSWGILAVLSSATAAAPQEGPTLADVAEWMRMPGVEVTVVERDCGQVNAYYYIAKREVVMCNELKEFDPALSRFILAHELAHAVIMQRDIPYTGSHEVAADELAAWVLGIRGDQAALIAASDFFADSAGEEDPFGDHPGDLRRAATLACIAVQSKGVYPGICSTDWGHISKTWPQLLKL